MTVSNTTNRKTFAGNGVTTAFATSPMVFFAAGDLTVYEVNDTTRVATLKTLTTHYTVSGGDGSTGTVTMLTAPATGTTLLILRELDITQGTDFVNNDASDAEVAEDALDRLTMICQELDTKISRSFALAESDVSGASTELPTPAATSLIGWNGAATALQNYTTSTLAAALTTAYTLTLLDDANAPAARSTLGFPAIAAKGDIIVGTAADTLAKKAVGTNGQILVAASGESDGLIWTDYTREPINVNPNWLIDQINEGALYTSIVGDTPGPDGCNLGSSGAGVFKVRTIADPRNAAKKVLEISCTTADASIAAGDYYALGFPVEGYDSADLMPGTASASKMTVMFELEMPVTGVYGVTVKNAANDRTYVGTVTQNVANTREQKVVTLTLDTSGTWLYTSGRGLNIGFCLAAGATFHGTANQWQAGNFLSTSAQANFMNVNTNVGYIGPVHIIPGGVALAYHKQDIRRELVKAQRQYEKSFGIGTAVAQNAGLGTGEFQWAANQAGANTQRSPSVLYKERKRASATVTLYNPAAANANARDASASVDCSGTAPENGSDTGFALACAGNAATVLAARLLIHWTANARLS